MAGDSRPGTADSRERAKRSGRSPHRYRGVGIDTYEWFDPEAERPEVLHGYTKAIHAPEGTVNITLNSDEEGLIEIFIAVGKAGSDIAALAEALSRTVNVALSLPGPVPRPVRTRILGEQLRFIGGSRTVGFGPDQVRSLPDAVGRAMLEHDVHDYAPEEAPRFGFEQRRFD